MEKLSKRTPTKIPGVYCRQGIHRRGKHKGKVDTVFDVSLKDSDGKKVWKKIGWKLDGVSLKLAAEYRSEWARDIRLGKPLPWKQKETPLFSVVAKQYLEWSDQNKSESNDHSRYKHLEKPLGGKRLNAISSFDLERLKSTLTKQGLAPATVKHCMVLVREIFNKAGAWGKYKGANPVKGVKLPTVNNRRERFLSHEEANLLLSNLAEVSPVLHDMALISLHCGVRAGEIFNLKGQDLDFENGLIRIMDPKNKVNRTAYMTVAVKEMLQTRIPEDRDDYIFKNRMNGEKIGEISKDFRGVVNKLFNENVEDPRQRVVFHTLRHTFGSWLAIQGTPILTIKELMGHKTLAMTERYAHLSPDVKKEATRTLELNFESSRNEKKVIPLEVAGGSPAG